MQGNAQSPKIFGIGLNKTGTTTLGQMGKTLGLRCTSCDRNLLEDFVLRKDFSRIRQVIEQFDLFEDWPWPLLYPELDKLYPGSRFILTVRQSEALWLESLKQHAMKTPPTGHCRKLAYGLSFPHGHEAYFLDFYRAHNDRARAYFAGRSDIFLELCWERGDGFEKLCRFLGYDVPDIPVPHANRGANVTAHTHRLLVNRVLSLLL